MSALGQPRMVWLDCGHDRIVMHAVNRKRKMRCPVCKTKVGITAASVIKRA